MTTSKPITYKLTKLCYLDLIKYNLLIIKHLPYCLLHKTNTTYTIIIYRSQKTLTEKTKSACFFCKLAN